MKYIVVVGSVVSGIGKGTVTSSVGALLQAYGKSVTAIKIDPYLNVDAGSISPLEHGEVFVLADGSEVDLDFGNYERFMNIILTNVHNITTGKLLQEIISKERKNEYFGKTIQMVPHLTDLIIEKIEKISRKKIVCGEPELNITIEPEICIIELGGTIGDAEGHIYVEALRRLRNKINKEDMIIINVELLPVLKNNEQKTKPLQNGIEQMKKLGLLPNIIVCRCESELTNTTKEKIAVFCDVEYDDVLQLSTFETVYEVPKILNGTNIIKTIFDKLKLENYKKIESYDRFDSIHTNKNITDITIAIIGKYIKHKDSYISLENALYFSVKHFGYNLKINWIEAFDLENKCEKAMTKLKSSHAVLIPGGFGTRGMEGKMVAANYARINKIPFLGICLGFQIAIIEFCRSVLGIKEATSEEFNANTKHMIIERINKTEPNQMRSGDHASVFSTDCKLKEVYDNKNYINERHRHKYMVNNKYISKIEKNGMLFVAKDETNKIAQLFELQNHDFFVGAQFHPEFNAKPNKPHLLFNEFVKKAYEYKTKVEREFY
ncbi:CTP synthase ura7 [Binucleata daphniae]